MSPPAPGRAAVITAADAIGVVLGAQILSFLWAAGATAAVWHGVLPDPLTPGAIVVLNVGLWVGYGVGPVLLARRRGGGAVSRYGLRFRWYDAPAGLAAGAAVQLAVLPVLYRPIRWFVHGDPGASAKALVDAASGPWGVLLLAFSTLLMAPLVEELCFRGLLLPALRPRLGPAGAVAVSATVFALLHLDALAFPGLLLFGVLSAVLALRTGRLGPSLAFHAGFNLATLVALGLR